MAILSIVKGYLSDLFRGGSKTVAIHQSSSKGKDETSLSCFAPGIEINPANGENLVLAKIGNSNSFVVSIGGTNQNIEPDTERGERKFYSVSEDGKTIKAILKLKNDGSAELKNDSGSYIIDSTGIHTVNEGTDNSVRYSELNTAFTNQDTATNGEFSKLSATISAMVTAFAALGVTIPPYTQATITTDISNSKVESFLLPTVIEEASED